MVSRVGEVLTSLIIPPLCKGRRGGVDINLPPLSPPPRQSSGHAYKGGDKSPLLTSNYIIELDLFNIAHKIISIKMKEAVYFPSFL